MVRISQHPIKSDTESILPLVLHPVTSPKPRKKSSSLKQLPQELPLDLLDGLQKSTNDVHPPNRKIVANVKIVSPEVLSEPVKKAGIGGNGKGYADKTAAMREKKEKMRKAYLDEQLERRQKEARTEKRRMPSKRARPSFVRTKGPSVLKDTFQAYMDEIGSADLLDQTKVIMLARAIKPGLAVEKLQREMEAHLGRRPSMPELAEKLGVDVAEVQKRRMASTAAKNELVAANLRLVTSVARKVTATKGANTAGIALDDMVQEGNVGLIRAAEKFDASKGYKFSTYATWWVRAYVMRSITTQSRSIKVPSTVVDEYARIRKSYNNLRENGIFKPTDEQVARTLGITPAKLRFVVNVVTRVPTSLDLKLNPYGDGSRSRCLGDIIKGEDNVEEKLVEDLRRRELDKALRSYLKPLERAVIRLRFGLDDGQPRTLRETGELLRLSKERIRQLLFRALAKMKTPEMERMLTDATTR